MIIVVIIVAAAAAVGDLYVSSFSSPPSSGANITCSSQPNSSAIQIAITKGASNSANGPGYAPDSITLVIGNNNTVTWTNDDSVHHTVNTSSAPTGAAFNSGNMNQGDTYTCTFTMPGTYQYYCVYHAWMTGVIVVKGA